MPLHDGAALVAEDATPQGVSRQASRIDDAPTPVSLLFTSDTVEGGSQSALIRVIEALREGKMAKRHVETVVPAFRDAVPTKLLPTEPGVDLELDDTLAELCSLGQLALVHGQLSPEGTITLRSTPAVGGLVLLCVHAPVLAPRFKEGWGSMSASGVSLLPRAVVLLRMLAGGARHFVVATERPLYPSPAYNNQGNRCALHCALMAIGSTDAWLAQSPCAVPEPRSRTPITMYDDFPSKMKNLSRKEFDDALRVDSGEDAYCYVLCDVSACPDEAAAVLLQSHVRGWRLRKARKAVPTRTGPPNEQQRCASALEHRGFYVARGARRLSADTKAKIQGSKGWENVFNGKDGKGRLTLHDDTRQQTSGEEDWHPEVLPLLEAEFRELGILQCSDGREKTLNRLVSLKSTRRRKKGKKHQPWHADSAPRDSLRDEPPQDVPLAALLAIQARTRLYVRPFDTDAEEVVELDEGDLLIFRGDLGHAGAEYDEEDLIDGMHLRLHVYIDSPLIQRQKESDGVPSTFPF